MEFILGFIIEFIVTVAGAILWIYFWALIIRVILSWVQVDSYHPIIRILYQITDPVIYRVRRFVPPIGPIDLSVMVLLILIQLIINRVLPRLAALAHSWMR